MNTYARTNEEIQLWVAIARICIELSVAIFGWTVTAAAVRPITIGDNGKAIIIFIETMSIAHRVCTTKRPHYITTAE